MSAIRLRRQIVRRRRHLTVLVAVFALAGAVALHHDGIVMGDMAGHHGMGAALEFCLGVVTAVGITAAAVALGVLLLGRLRRPSTVSPVRHLVHARRPIARARAGPPLLCVLCVSRR